jgi:hypothetical protein
LHSFPAPNWNSFLAPGGNVHAAPSSLELRTRRSPKFNAPKRSSANLPVRIVRAATGAIDGVQDLIFAHPGLDWLL